MLLGCVLTPILHFNAIHSEHSYIPFCFVFFFVTQTCRLSRGVSSFYTHCMQIYVHYTRSNVSVSAREVKLQYQATPETGHSGRC